MTIFRDRYLGQHFHLPLLIYDVGSQDVNGSYKGIFANSLWRYRGVDMAPGKNVDIVLRHPYRFRTIPSRSADVVISGQAFEHIDYFWITMLEITRVLKPSGLCCILAPSAGPEHRYPKDCWRFFPDGMRAAAAFACLEVVEASTQWNDLGYEDGSDQWHDTMLVARKPDHGRWGNFLCGFYCWIRHLALTFRKP
ncbi:methyltransferase domain-containing protein [Desulfatitalea alkaliphila]|uniref:Class I SAM-dependent methyltransferase n=1 Tax=Desulfatitalea alkaliphila TaxID=2929485 RepID=A0AA41UJH9_9BACT|nr:methyltransferase domain-containing protein [Desulfatitalea alkaliphila]MCJ8499396.1 class I SAM-dependent methyltransferase [Desulfatitalea alkaliphila]